MNKQTMVVIALLFFASVLVMFALSHYALQPETRSNGFSRTFLPEAVLVAEDTLDLGFDSYYLAGHTDHTLYLGNIVAPRHVLSLSIPALDSQHFELEIMEPRALRISSIQVAVDSPSVFLCDGTSPVIYEGELASSQLSPADVRGTYFLDVVPAGHFGFMMRVLDEKRENALAVLQLHPFHVRLASIDLDRQIDGFFCTNGKLHYNQENKSMIYVYTYRNRYLRIDSSLSRAYVGMTIDTTSRANISVATITSSETRTLSRPATVVNRLSAVRENYLLINSGLIADNEAFDDFRNSSVIDIYDLLSMRYRGSFYVPHWDDKRMNDFAIVDNKLVVLYERALVVFNLAAGDLLISH